MGVDDIIEEEYGTMAASVNEQQRAAQTPQGQQPQQSQQPQQPQNNPFASGTIPVEGLVSVVSFEKTDLMFVMLVLQTLLLAYIAREL